MEYLGSVTAASVSERCAATDTRGVWGRRGPARFSPRSGREFAVAISGRAPNEPVPQLQDLSKGKATTGGPQNLGYDLRKLSTVRDCSCDELATAHAGTRRSPDAPAAVPPRTGRAATCTNGAKRDRLCARLGHKPGRDVLCGVELTGCDRSCVHNRRQWGQPPAEDSLRPGNVVDKRSHRSRISEAATSYACLIEPCPEGGGRCTDVPARDAAGPRLLMRRNRAAMRDQRCAEPQSRAWPCAGPP